jgi:predicted nucleotidyltransferase
MRPADDPLLQRFRATLDEIYGQRLERVVLYGSRARGAARDESDYDIAVFLRDYTPGTTTELYRRARAADGAAAPATG